MKRTLIAKVARYVVNHSGVLAVLRPAVSWTTYVQAGGPLLAKR